MPAQDLLSMSPLGFFCLLGCALFFLALPRRFAIFPLVVSACFMPLSQGVLISGLHFNAMRIVIFFGWLRLLLRGELRPFLRLNTVDKLIISYAVVGFLNYIILWQTSGAFKNQLGFLYNTFGLYFLCRFLVRAPEDIERTVKCLALSLIPIAVLMTIEMLTGRNVFSVFGSVAEMSEIREGSVRCQGPFSHPILAGTVGAVSVPLIAGLLMETTNRKLWLTIAICASNMIVITSHSSGPLMALIFGLIGLLSWIWKKHMRPMRWGILLALIALHLAMEAPVWYLIGRVSGLVGGGGYHRAHLINQAIFYFSEWWLIGTKVTAHWMATVLASDPNSADITNHFIAQGVSGGMPKLILFTWIIVECFKTIGIAVQMDERISRLRSIFIWSLGASLLSHVVSFISVSYFDQTYVFWYLLIASIALMRSRIELAKICWLGRP